METKTPTKLTYIEFMFKHGKPIVLLKNIVNRNNIKNLNNDGFWWEEKSGLHLLWFDMEIFEKHINKKNYKLLKKIIESDVES
jgi:hypothetical protein